MTDEELKEIIDACKPVPVMYMDGGQLLFGSRQENANYAWEKLGKKLGFKYMTVKPNGKGNKFFTAEEIK